MGKALTNEDFIKRVYSLVGDKYSVLDEYKGRHEKVLIQHKECGYTWYVEAGAFLGNKNKKGSRCPQCYGNVNKTTATFGEEVNQATSGEYRLVSKYKNAHTKVRIEHTLCGNTYECAPMSFTAGTRCPYCANQKIDNQEVNHRLELLTKGQYTLASDYTGVFNKIKLQHKICGHFMYTTLAKLDAKVIPICHLCNPSSHGESLIQIVLEDIGVRYEQQKRFDTISRLSYDFYLEYYGILIEYQGEQHYKPVKFFGGQDVFEKQQRRDNNKRNFAQEQGLLLVEIPYTLTDIAGIRTLIVNYLSNAETPTPKGRSMI